jgi:hypothetical protein
VKSYSVVLAFALGLLVGCGQLDASAVAEQGTRLESTTSEATLLAQGAAAGRFSSPFVSARAAELAQDSADVQDSLQEGKVEPSARQRAAELEQVAGRVESAMRSLGGQPGDRALAARVAAELEQARGGLERR